ncbi:hypothetical protein TNCV_4470211 [Trichonephila clavipes]|nr:hypothetical protein TNCV_4470211 [Trichonephila clavipes]
MMRVTVAMAAGDRAKEDLERSWALQLATFGSSVYALDDGDERNPYSGWSVAQKLPKGFLRVAGFYYKYKLDIKKKSKAKTNSLYYQQNILEPIFEEETRALYGGEIELHINKASSHTSKSTPLI